MKYNVMQMTTLKKDIVRFLYHPLLEEWLVYALYYYPSAMLEL